MYESNWSEQVVSSNYIETSKLFMAAAWIQLAIVKQILTNNNFHGRREKVSHKFRQRLVQNQKKNSNLSFRATYTKIYL